MLTDRSQELIQTTVLCRMLLETLARLDGPIASDDFIVELRDVCERARAQLGEIQG
jgi:hypothetical protein